MKKALMRADLLFLQEHQWRHVWVRHQWQLRSCPLPVLIAAVGTSATAAGCAAPMPLTRWPSAASLHPALAHDTKLATRP